MIPLSFRQLNIRGTDSLVLSFVDPDAGVALDFDNRSQFPDAARDPVGTRREILSLDQGTFTLITWPANPSRSKGLRTALAGNVDGPHRGILMSAFCRDLDGVQLAQQVFRTLRFPGNFRLEPTGPQKTAWSLAQLEALGEIRRALMFPVVNNDAPVDGGRTFPDAQAVMLALRLLRLAERPDFARLALPALDHPNSEAVVAAARYILWSKDLPTSTRLLCRLLEVHNDYPHECEPVVAILSERMDPAAIPSLKIALERRVRGSAPALGSLGGADCFSLILESRMEDTAEGLRRLIRRSNRSLEPWMIEAPLTSETLNRWWEWWSLHKDGFEIVEPVNALRPPK